ncbi:MAG: hypothetical protein R3208_07630 [Ketobacteraceae bacterium]|nr:hypothetical protein [Ketobacteraceae bacterium]
MSRVEVDIELLRALLDAAVRTARSHRGKPRELYVLGQLESAANTAYILAAGKVDYEFEAYCQQLAAEAIDRMELISQRPSDRQAGYPQSG